MTAPAGASDEPITAPASARRFVAVLLALLLVPGVIGFDAWPLTGWRLFSADRGDRQTRWEISTVATDGSLAPFDLDELPIAYRNAEWILAELPDADDARREEVCQALLDGVVEHGGDEATDGLAGLAIVRNRRTMESIDGAFVVVDDREPLHTCGLR